MSTGYEFTERSELDTAVNLWISNEASAKETYGEINDWNVTKINDFSDLFLNETLFDSDISNWDVSNGTDFSGMFDGAEAFNQDISYWDVSKGTDFSGMFDSATKMNNNGWEITPSLSDFHLEFEKYDSNS